MKGTQKSTVFGKSIKTDRNFTQKLFKIGKAFVEANCIDQSVSLNRIIISLIKKMSTQ